MQDRAIGHLPLCASILSVYMPEKDLIDDSPLECESARTPLGQVLSKAALAEASEVGSQS